MSTILLKNGNVVMPDRVIPNGEVLIENGIITLVGRMSHHYGRSADRIIDAQGGYILPGFIDTHSDAIEKELEPRPGAFFTTDVAFGELEKKLAGQGITTMYHSFSFAGAQYGVRADRVAADCIRSIVNMARKYASIRNKIHLRFEITNFEALELVHDLINEGSIELLSFMDHTPGQGQYPTIEDYRRYLEKTYHLQLDEIGGILALKEQGRLKSGECVARLSQAARTKGIPLASHDDDSPDSISYYQQQGVTLSEFPINLPTAAAARQAGVDVSVGAPNIVRGGSTGKGMRAIEAIAAGSANILCSDYYPPALLHAVFLLAEETLSTAEAVALATAAPAKALNLQDTGSLEEGKCGDILVVRKRNNTPVVTNTIVGGVLVYTMDYRVTLTDDRAEQSAS